MRHALAVASLLLPLDQTAYLFQVNPAGVQNDFAYFDDTQINNDYDAVWEVATAVTFRATMWRATGLGRNRNPRPQERRMTDKRMLVCFVAAPAAMGAALSAHHSHAVYGDTQ